MFLFDEPLSNLDARLREETRAELVRLHRELRTTMVCVTHDQVEAMTMGQRIAVLRDGRLQQVAAPLAVYHRPAYRFVASFIGSPPMNVFEGRLEAGDDALRFRSPSFEMTVPPHGPCRFHPRRRPLFREARRVRREPAYDRGKALDVSRTPASRESLRSD